MLSRANAEVVSQLFLVMGFALIEVSEHVLVAAKRVLRSVPSAKLQTEGRERRSASPGVDDPNTTGGAERGRRDLCETVVDREW